MYTEDTTKITRVMPDFAVLVSIQLLSSTIIRSLTFTADDILVSPGRGRWPMLDSLAHTDFE